MQSDQSRELHQEKVISARKRKVIKQIIIKSVILLLCPSPVSARHLAMLLSDVRLSVCLSVTYIGNISRTERPRKTRTPLSRSKGQLAGAWNIVADSRTSLVFINLLIFMLPTAIGSKACWAPQA